MSRVTPSSDSEVTAGGGGVSQPKRRRKHNDALEGTLASITSSRHADVVKVSNLAKLMKVRQFADNWKDKAIKRSDTYEKLPTIVTYLYGAPQFSMLSLTLIISVYGNTYYERMGAPLTFIAFFTALARSFDIMTDPIMGWVSDNTRLAFGRRRPYMLVGMPFFSILFVLLMYPPIGTPSQVSTWFGLFYIFFYLSDTIANVPYSALGPELTSDSAERTTIFFYGKLYAGVGTLLGATAPELFKRALGSPGETREELRMIFLLVGLTFGGFYLLFMGLVVLLVKEREQSQESPAIPLVPSVLRSFKNPAFRPLLVGWIFDAIALSALSSTFPFFITYVIQPDPKVMSDSTTLALAFGALFVSAIVSMPLWKLAAAYYGRYRVWMAFNLLNFVTNSLYIFVGKGDPKTTIAITAINGLPLGGTFLTDSILADVIDYDEFLNGTRNEGGFTVFATFIPKFVSVPASALPLSTMSMIGFVRSNPDGTVNEQPVAVRNFIRFVFVVVPCFCTLMAFFAKRRYPLKTEEHVEKVNAGIEAHLAGKPARDPVTGGIVELPEYSEEEREIAWVLDNFTRKQLQTMLETGKKNHMIRDITVELVVGIVTTLALILTVVFTFGFLSDDALSIVPILAVTSVGIAICYVAVSVLRLYAAINLNPKKMPQKLLESVIEQKELGQRGGSLLDRETELQRYHDLVRDLTDRIQRRDDYIKTLKAAMGGQEIPSPPGTPTPGSETSEGDDEDGGEGVNGTRASPEPAMLTAALAANALKDKPQEVLV